MGNAATRSLERVAAAMGILESAPVEFQATCDVAQGGVLVALPALLAAGLLRRTPEFYQLPNGFYGLESIFLLLALMALARIRSLEQLRYQAPGEWGKLLGLDRIPEVRTLRAKLKLLCQDMGRALRWNAELAKEWIARQNDTELTPSNTDGFDAREAGSLHHFHSANLCPLQLEESALGRRESAVAERPGY